MRQESLLEIEIGSKLLTEEQIQAKVKELGKKISSDYQGRELLMVGILKGAFVFLSDLAREITVPTTFDFVTVSSYGSATKSSGVVRIMKDISQEIEGRHVLIVEDIIDSGLTLNYLVKNFRARHPASLEVCALLSKPERQRVPIDIKYLGFTIPNKFVVGYGLDFSESYRNLRHIAVIKEKS